MKFLQIKNTDQPKILELGKDFDLVNKLTLFKTLRRNTLTETSPKQYVLTVEIVAFIDDCYKSRPLLEFDGYCEFDLLEVWHSTLTGVCHYDIIRPIEMSEKRIYSNPIDYIQSLQSNKEMYKNLGCVYLPENLEKIEKIKKSNPEQVRTLYLENIKLV